MKIDFVGMEKLSLVDYEGKLCTTIFSNNCNFRCPFCQNSSLVFNEIDTFLNFDEIINYLKKRVNVIEGICLTGGEVTLMPDLEYKISKIKELGFSIKLDTNGTHPELMKKLVEEKLIDYVAMDIKNCYSKYSKTIGLNNYDLSKIKESIEYLKQNHVDYEFRTTLVKEFHNLGDIQEMSQTLIGAKKLFLQHFVDNGTCIKDGLHEIDKETAIRFKEILQENISQVELRGYK